MAMTPGAARTETVRGEYVVLELHAPGAAVGVPVGLLLLDPGEDRLHVRIRERLPEGLEAMDRQVLQGLLWELHERAQQESGKDLLGWLEDSFSHTLRLSEREAVLLALDGQGSGGRSAARQADALFARRMVAAPAGAHSTGDGDVFEDQPSRASQDSDDPAAIVPFRTHLPFYPMRIAAGVFGGDAEVEAAGWVPVPPGLRVDQRYFTARITGRSMEPAVPDGSLCLFRAHPQGSREGKLLLVQKHGASQSGGEYAIKRYHSEKAVLPQGAMEEFDDAPEWRHSRVRLISLNPDYPSWDLEADQCQVIAEFVRVLELEEIPQELQ
ncbi:MAG: S24 family peptidase [Bryobacterales bacterium]|jgi:hypothetical protein|nr:S24 family peptidase [Bryobacterales bacterium]